MNFHARQTLEKTNADHFAVNSLSIPDLSLWQSYKATWREVVWLGRSFKLYNTADTLDTFKVVTADASFEHGLGVEIEYADGQYQWIDHKPSKLRHGVFAWVPYLPEVRFLDNGRGSKYSLSLPLTFKSANAPNYFQEGFTYISFNE